MLEHIKDVAREHGVDGIRTVQHVLNRFLEPPGIKPTGVFDNQTKLAIKTVSRSNAKKFNKALFEKRLNKYPLQGNVDERYWKRLEWKRFTK